MAAPLADFVISLHDGRVNSQGSVKNALASNKLLAQQLKHEGEAIELDEHEESEPSDFTAPPAQDEPAKAMNGKLVIAEEIEVGHVSWKACGCLRGYFPSVMLTWHLSFLISGQLGRQMADNVLEQLLGWRIYIGMLQYDAALVAWLLGAPVLSTLVK